MQDTPMQKKADREVTDYHAGFARIMRFSRQARLHGWMLSDRQMIKEILVRERAAQIREKSSLPMVGAEVRSASWNRGQADALRSLLQSQREQYGKGL
jgi:hypothetical protein